MANRAFIAAKGEQTGIYVNWNGGRDSVEAFLRYAELKGLHSLERHKIGFLTILTNFFGNDGRGVDLVNFTGPVERVDLDHGDNGTYVVEGWTIVDRITRPGHVEQRGYDLNEMLQHIDSKQPEHEQLGAVITAAEVPVSDLQVGDEVWRFDDVYGRYDRTVVVGFGDSQPVNGKSREGVPYVNKYGDTAEEHKRNPNNYLEGPTVLV